MQIVINVDNELYEYFSKRRSMHDDGYFSHIGKLIKTLRDGTPLPKRLINADKFINSLKGIERLHIDDELRYNILNAIYSSTLEADKEG